MGFWGSQGGVRRRASINILFNTVFWGVRGEGGWDMRNLAMVLKLLPGFFIGVWGVVGGGGVGWVGVSLFWAVGAGVDCDQRRELGVRPSLSQVYPAGKLQSHFTCGFDFRQSMTAIYSRFCSPEGVINSSCWNYGSFLTWG